MPVVPGRPGFAPDLGGDGRGHDLSLGLGEHAGFGEQHRVEQPDGGHVADGVHTRVVHLQGVGVREDLESLGMGGHVAAGVVQAGVGHHGRCPVRWDPDEEVVGDGLVLEVEDAATRLDAGDGVERVIPDPTFGQHGLERRADRGAGHRHGLRLGRVQRDLDLVPYSASPGHGFDEHRCFVGSGRAAERSAGDEDDDVAAVEAGQRVVERQGGLGLVEIEGGLRESWHRLRRQLGAEREDRVVPH